VFRFRKLKEEESRRKEVLGQAKQSEQSSSESSFLDETQNPDASSGDKKYQQVVSIFVTFIWFISAGEVLLTDNEY
jgi:hypothetical protein